MTLKLRAETSFILNTLTQAGFDAYLVGGAVRDLLLKRPTTDFDFATNASPDQIRQLFPESYYENEFGTVSITHKELLNQMGLSPQEAGLIQQQSQSTRRIIELAQMTKLHPSLQELSPVVNQQNDLPESQSTDTNQDENNRFSFYPDFEITTYRSQEVYSDFRRPDPDKLVWGSSIEEDLARRDFTINAIAADISGKLTDPYDGQTDLSQQLIRTVGDPDTRFKEDALRMLRAIRFAVQLGFKIDVVTYDAIIRQHPLLNHVSGERIRDEFFKIILSPQPKLGVQLLDETGLLGVFLPELLTTKDVEQGGHHTTDVWTHSIDALQASPSQDPVVRLATLLHDIGKPQTFQLRGGEITFYNHEVVGSRIANSIGKRLRLSRKQLNRLFILVRQHMFYYQPDHTDAAIRRFIKRVGLENIDDILDVREADRLGSGSKKTSWRLEEMKQRIVEQLNQPMEVTDLAVDGTELIDYFQLQPGPWLGELLQKLLDLVLENPELNTKSDLLHQAELLVNHQQT